MLVRRLPRMGVEGGEGQAVGLGVVHRGEHLPGKPLVYATSRNFMDYFGINSSEDLPKIKEVFAEQLVQPTLINDNDFKTAEADEEINLPEGKKEVHGP